MTPDAATIPSVAPNQPKTPMHSFRAPRDEWDAAMDEALRREETLTDALRRALRVYAAGGLRDE